MNNQGKGGFSINVVLTIYEFNHFRKNIILTDTTIKL